MVIEQGEQIQAVLNKTTIFTYKGTTMNSKPDTDDTIQNLKNEELEQVSDSEMADVSGGLGGLSPTATQAEIKAYNDKMEMQSNLLWKQAQITKNIIGNMK